MSRMPLYVVVGLNGQPLPPGAKKDHVMKVVNERQGPVSLQVNVDVVWEEA